MTSIDDLVKLGGIVSAEPVERTVEWDGNTFTVLVKRISYGMVERVLIKPDDDEQSRNAALISGSILLNGGTESLTYEQAFQLKPSLAFALVDAIRSVNGMVLEATDKPKNSRRKRNSGTT